MKAIVKNGLVAIVCGVTALPAGTAQANDIEDFFKRAHRSLVKRHKEIVRAHTGVARAAAAAAPRVRSVSVRVGTPTRTVYVRPTPSPRHVCRKIKVKTWVQGYWEETVEQRWVSYRHRHGGYYQDIIVKRWVPGYHEYTWEKDPNCSCRRTSYSRHGRHHSHSDRSYHSSHSRHGRDSHHGSRDRRNSCSSGGHDRHRR